MVEEGVVDDHRGAADGLDAVRDEGERAGAPVRPRLTQLWHVLRGCSDDDGAECVSGRSIDSLPVRGSSLTP
jgi:hypothetical protein